MGIKLRAIRVAIIVVALGNIGFSQSTRTNDLKLDALIDALQSRDTRRAQEIISSGINLNQHDRFGRTPLNEAIEDHLSAVAIEMINKGADVNLTPSRQFSPLMTSAWYCEKEILMSLLDHGAKVDARDEDGATALIYGSANCKRGEIVQVLLRAGANPNAAANNGYTGLIAAAESGNEVAVRELLLKGADVNAKNSEGETALSIATNHPFRTKSHERISALLKANNRNGNGEQDKQSN